MGGVGAGGKGVGSYLLYKTVFRLPDTRATLASVTSASAIKAPASRSVPPEDSRPRISEEAEEAWSACRNLMREPTIGQWSHDAGPLCQFAPTSSAP